MFHRLTPRFDPERLARCRSEDLMVRLAAFLFWEAQDVPSEVQALVAATRPDKVRFVTVRSTEVLIHQDRAAGCNLNVYVTTGGGTTQFWNPVGDAAAKMHKGVAFAQGLGLVLGSVFVAEPGDAYLFPAHIWHSVTPDEGIARRQFLQLVWRTAEFSEVLDRVQAFEQSCP